MATVAEWVERVVSFEAQYDGYHENYDGTETLFSTDQGEFDAWAQWCGLFQEFGFRHGAGIIPGGPVIPRLYYTVSAAYDAISRGQWITDPAQVQRGHLTLFNWEGWGQGAIDAIDHIGMHLEFNDGGCVQREGNILVDGVPSVGVFTRDLSVISGWIRPKWELVATAPIVTPKPAQQQEDEVPTLIQAAGKPVAWVIGSTVVLQSAPDTIKATSGPAPSVITMTPGDWDKWWKSHLASLPK